MGSADRVHPRLGKAEMLHLAAGDELLHRAGDIFDRHIGVGPVLVEEINAVGLEPLQGLIGDFANTLRPAVEPCS
jgi:hypothetical protein